MLWGNHLLPILNIYVSEKAEPMLGPQGGWSSQAMSQDCYSDGHRDTAPLQSPGGSEPSVDFWHRDFSPLDMKVSGSGV